MSQDNHIILACTVCGKNNYDDNKNKKIKLRLEKSKFCKSCGHHTPHKESK